MAYDLIIVGGGIGGSALAATMAKAGQSVLLLEKSTAYEDRVRGEWIAPWGVAETKRLGLYDLLKGAGGHHITSHVTYDESYDPQTAEQTALPLGIFAEGVPGPLTIGHPHHCQTLFDEAVRAGAKALRGVTVTDVKLGASPSVTYEADGETQTTTAPLVVGAEGRQSLIRKEAGIALHQDKPHHWFAGLLVEGVDGWEVTRQAIGTEGNFGFLAFPQGGDRVRVYGGYALDEKGRFAGEDGARKFLDAFRMRSAPANEALAAGKPAGPLFSYFNNDSWTDEPFAEGCVLIGDAAGWNDPINGLGLSITYRDVRIVSDILKATAGGAAPDFSSYAEERTERMRRLRFAGQLQAALDMEFSEDARARRRSYHERRAADPALGLHGFAIMGGPESVPAEIFTEAHREKVLNG
ncbi:FAD-dependent monooxygenase [Henriciella mobilis]|uniref:FAD-dependent oxidoreductase n=1 Tax=Henriciella mobilis TaxID=2305467 RepID=UPI000E6629B0|nr:FAD-dependent monooxygenase [Henriciella mobilis]RIJ13948.1 FAD-dependent monooxygenase [Henriciella mobilis]RIJ20843.1 FAD-dependent monooxygenase [Henriciella mobilis]